MRGGGETTRDKAIYTDSTKPKTVLHNENASLAQEFRF